MSDDHAERLAGPPEPVVGDDGETRIYIPTGEPVETGNPLETVELGEFRCDRCNVVTPGTVSEGSINEPHECEGCERQGPFTHAGGLTESEFQAALRADRMWHPPSGIEAEGYREIWDDVNEYLRDHWDAGSGDGADAIYTGLTAFALSTWVRPQLTFVPHLMLMGTTTGGKTRLLNTLARVSYRAHVTASATPASMFRLIDAYDVTYLVSEYHGLPYDTQRQLDAVVRAGQKRGEYVDRAEQTATGYEPDSFDPFTHIGVATQFEPDDDIINRTVRVRSSPADRDMPATHDEERARELRNRLLYARFRLLESEEWSQAEEAAYEYLAQRDITGRTREKLLSLLTVAVVWERNNPAFGDFIDEVIEQDREAAADSEDALVVEAIRDLAFETVGNMAVLGDSDPFAAVEIPLTDVAERFEDMTGTEKSAAWVGQVRARLGLEKQRKRDGTVIADPDLGPKLRELCEEQRLGWEPLESHRSVIELDEEERVQSQCPECGRQGRMTHRHVEDGHRMCNSCASDWEDADA